MVLFALRILFPAAFILCLLEGAEMSRSAANLWDVEGLFYALLALLMAMGAGMVWAPWIGEKIADPLTNMLTSGDTIEGDHPVTKLVNALLLRGWRRTALAVCFLETLRHEHAPTIAWIALQNSPPGSWLEREFAWTVYRHHNAAHCVAAHRILRRHGIKPGPHVDPMVMLFIQADEQQPKAAHPPVELPPAPAPPGLQRDPRIRLFELDEALMKMQIKEREAAASQSGTTAAPIFKETPPPSRPPTPAVPKPLLLRLREWISR
jgi:hypothetical protein